MNVSAVRDAVTDMDTEIKRSVSARGRAGGLLMLLVFAIVVAGAIVLVERLVRQVSPSQLPIPAAALVGGEDGLFLGDAAAAGARPIFDAGRVLDVRRSPSGSRIAVSYVPSLVGDGPNSAVAVLGATGVPVPGSAPGGRLGSLREGEHGLVPDAGDIAWAPAPVRGHEALAVATGFGLLVVDENGAPLVDERVEDGWGSPRGGISWSRPDALGTVRLAWGFGSSVWMTTIPRGGPVTTRELVDLRPVDTVRQASPAGEAVSRVAISPDGARVAAVISGCGFACRAGLWLVDDRGGTRLLDDAAQTDAWLSFADDGRSVLAGLWDDGGRSGGGRLVMVPVDGGPQVDLRLDPLRGSDVYPLHARWLPGRDRILVAAQAASRTDWTNVAPIRLDFWTVTPGGAEFERIATDAYAVDPSR
jgi:hypothetical protein